MSATGAGLQAGGGRVGGGRPRLRAAPHAIHTGGGRGVPACQPPNSPQVQAAHFHSSKVNDQFEKLAAKKRTVRE